MEVRETSHAAPSAADGVPGTTTMHPAELAELNHPTASGRVAPTPDPARPTARSPLETSAWLALLVLTGTTWPRVAGLLGIEVPDRTAAVLRTVVAVSMMTLAAVSCARAAAVHVGRHRAAWATLGAGIALLAVGNLASIDTVGTLRQTEEALHPFDDVAAGAGFVLFIVGLCLVPSDRRRNRVRRLNTALMVVATLTLLWVGVVDEVLDNVSRGEFLAVMVPFLSLAAVLITVLGALTARCRLDRRPDVRGLLGGSAVLLASNLLTILAVVGQRTNAATAVGQALQVAGFALLGIAAGRARLGMTDAERVRTSTDRFQRNAPLIAIVAAMVGVVVHEALEGSADLPTLLLGVACVLLATLRLSVLDRAQRRLTASLSRVATRLETEAATDALTGLGNRAALADHLAAALDRRAPSGVAVFYIDVDHFKSVNDGLGHEGGDELLVEIGDRLRSVLGDDVFRLGGDEFVAVREDLDRDESEAVATALVAAMEHPVHVQGRRLRAAVSVGLARSEVRREPEHLPGSGWPTRRADTPDALLRRADLALYRAKELGRSRWAGYDPWLQQRADRHLQMQQGLHQALTAGEIDVYFQPVVELATGDVVGAEALVRWHSPDHGLVLPNDFLPVAAEAGLLPEIARRVVQTVEARLAETRGEDLWISVNLSPSELCHPAVVAQLSGAAADVERGRLWLGVREASVIDESSAQVLAQLRSEGVRVLVEGFGSGPSSLRHLADYPADAISVDRSFVDGLGEDPGDTAIVEAVATLGTDLSLVLVGEGVTDDRQADLLTSLGYRLATGWRYGRPLPWSEFAARRSEVGAGPALDRDPVG